MNEDERAIVQAINATEPVITVSEIRKWAYRSNDRTLMFGFSKDPVTTWHVYLKEGKIHRLLYGSTFERDEHGTFLSEDQLVEYHVGDSFECRLLVPTKRAYSESTDFLFARLMAERGYPLCFTTHDPERDIQRKAGVLGRTTPSIYAGLIREELP